MADLIDGIGHRSCLTLHFYDAASSFHAYDYFSNVLPVFHVSMRLCHLGEVKSLCTTGNILPAQTCGPGPA